MKGFGNKLALFLLYLAVAGITFYMYNLRLEQHDSPWDIISRSGAEVPADENLVGKNIISTKRTRNFLLSDIQLVSLIEESTDSCIFIYIENEIWVFTLILIFRQTESECNAFSQTVARCTHSLTLPSAICHFLYSAHSRNDRH